MEPTHEEPITSDGITRRDFMKAAGAVGAAVAAAPLLKHIPESAVEHVAAPAAERAFEDTLVHTAEETGANVVEKVGFRGLLGKMMNEHVWGSDGEGYIEVNLDDDPLHRSFDDVASHMEKSMDEVASKFTPKQQALLEKAAAKLDKYPIDVRSAMFHEHYPEFVGEEEFQAFTNGVRKTHLEDRFSPEDVEELQGLYSKNGRNWDKILEDVRSGDLTSLDPDEIEMDLPNIANIIDPSLPRLTVEESKAYEKFLKLTHRKMGEFFDSK
jgi:hypothetical protein